MIRDYVRWHSRHLDRDMEFLWFGHWGKPVVMFPTSMARFYENEDFKLIDALADKIDAGLIQVCCVDTVTSESWYNRGAHPGWRAWRHEQYDRYLADELVPYVMHRAQRSDVAVYGASFGAFHAATFAAKHPHMVQKAILFSGVFDIRENLDGYWNDTCYFNNPVSFIPHVSDELARELDRIDWIIATGEYDHIRQFSHDFSQILWNRGISNHLEIWRWCFGHDWPWWREHVRRFLP